MLCQGSRKMGEMRGAPSPQHASFRSFNQQTSIALMQRCAQVGVERSMSQATALKEPNSERELPEVKWHQSSAKTHSPGS